MTDEATLIDPENNELTQRLFRIKSSVETEFNDHKGQCRSLDILLSHEYAWMIDFLVRCQGTIKQLKKINDALSEGLKMAADLEENSLIDFKKYGLETGRDILKKYKAAIALAEEEGKK